MRAPHRHGEGHGHGTGEMPGPFGDPEHYERAWRVLIGDLLYRRIVRDVAAAGLPAGAFVLDAGTGPGRVPRLLAEKRPDLRIEGFDVSERMIAHATAHAPAGVDFRVADVAHLPYGDGAADLVISSLSLHHWPDREAGLAEVRRVLAPGGRAWIYDLRRVLRQAAPAGARVEPVRFTPIGRLVVTR